MNNCCIIFSRNYKSAKGSHVPFSLWTSRNRIWPCGLHSVFSGFQPSHYSLCEWDHHRKNTCAIHLSDNKAQNLCRYFFVTFVDPFYIFLPVPGRERKVHHKRNNTIDNETISDDVIVDLVNGTTKKDLPGNYEDLSSFLTGVFLYVIKFAKNTGTNLEIWEILVQKNTYIKDIISIPERWTMLLGWLHRWLLVYKRQ